MCYQIKNNLDICQRKWETPPICDVFSSREQPFEGKCTKLLCVSVIQSIYYPLLPFRTYNNPNISDTRWFITEKAFLGSLLNKYYRNRSPIQFDVRYYDYDDPKTNIEKICINNKSKLIIHIPLIHHG